MEDVPTDISIPNQPIHPIYPTYSSGAGKTHHVQTSTRVSNLEKSREILTSLAPSRSKKLNFHSLSLLDFQDFEEKILFLFSIYENLKHKSRSLLDLDLEFSSGSVCVWN